MESAYTRCAACIATFPKQGRKRFCSTLCWDVFHGRRFIGPEGYVIACAVCGERKAVQRPQAKTCHACAPEWQRRRNVTWREANPEKGRESERRRAATDKRRTYHRELAREKRLRERAVRLAPRWAAAAREVERTWLALPPAPPVPLLPRPSAGPCQSLAAAPRTRLFIGAACAGCDVALVLTRLPDEYHRNQFCSPRCSKRFWRRQYRRDARRATDPETRAAVFAHDDYVCQLCGQPVDLDAEVPALRAPVIDHIVPRGDYGPDAIENMQTAHFYCNSVKRDLSMEEFQALYLPTRAYGA